MSTQPTWFKSSHSGNEGGACVEVALGSATVYVRDSKDTARPALTLAPAAWTAFLGLAARADA
ncbi:DUF397 domain-containing protein [Streptomyces sp. UH6]|uniref:DUF397 domain-containing protein n=1 Tax=Streptomyces sp. UH6 TaxID=2748379 RepID=UPI0015D48803|nr:DUF397 domain-containing protein [Streptomyces sp. UH6]NYV73985.1 DUF397 domain-containing protein [Streptomyces sp. UH6]